MNNRFSNRIWLVAVFALVASGCQAKRPPSVYVPPEGGFGFPDGRSALMRVAARLRHIAETQWGSKSYLCMERLYELERMKEAI
ncbi:hypothetical protein P9H32_15405 [Pontiella sp. NLcol2]|uniref:Uncharacterized protein n=1 Tax=Pontiella agarivorans TaxID=3038953 RepID=A0ABU5N0P7_9BACT|nr:hypothetical protein [Pontiella agarivorans]MDZ8120017.1 hypothetical protein [Pontiella agarivorans]